MANTLRRIAQASGLRPTSETFIGFAQRLAKERGIRVDRLAKRKKPAIICWFCENCLDLVHNPQILMPKTPLTGLANPFATSKAPDDLSAPFSPPASTEPQDIWSQAAMSSFPEYEEQMDFDDLDYRND
jgi:hypothetical protein